MKKKPSITVIGSNMIDLITRVNRMPRQGETVEAPDFDLGFGGKGANQAVAASLLGAEVVLIARVGDDIFGREVIKNFESFGIDTAYVEVAKGTTNGVAPIFVGEDGNNSILIIKGANAFVSKEDVERASEKILKSDLILLQLEIPLETVYYAVEFGHTHNIPVLLNPAPGVPLDFQYVSKVTTLIPNETELETITGLPVVSMDKIENAAKWLLEKGVRTVIVTLGERGSLLVTDQRVELVSPVEVTPKDTTGAGDAFIGAFAFYFVLTGNTAEAMRYANHYAALSTLKTGTQKSFYTKEEFEKAVLDR
jgi:ribokinase